MTDFYTLQEQVPDLFFTLTFTPQLDLFKPPQFAAPRKKSMNKWVDLLRTQNLLILGGSHEVDKSSLARYVAWYLREQVLGINASSSNQLPIQEWSGYYNLQNLVINKIRETMAPTIFILPQVLPQHINYDLRQIHKAVVDRDHFLIISSEASQISWHLPSSLRSLWQNLLPEEIYGPEELADVLIGSLNDRRFLLPKGIIQSRLTPDTSIVEDSSISIKQIASDLKTPNNINVFVQALCSEKGEVTEARIYDLLQFAFDRQDTLSVWFYNILQPREQLLAIGLTLFDGLFDDQFFMAFEAVVESDWHRRDESLRAIDQADLNNLLSFFNLVKTRTSSDRIQSRLPNQRMNLLRIAKDSYRMRIRAALPVMVMLVKNSTTTKSLERELYGSETRRDQLRRVISESISDLGLVSLNLVENILLQLAADTEDTVRRVAAQALARWRTSGDDLKLFELLNEWQRGGHSTKFISVITNQYEKKESPLAYINATIAFTLEYAARYDAPDTLSIDELT